LEFLDLFTPNNISCESRARAFLWFCYHYHEGPSSDADDDQPPLNPFSDPRRGSNKMPRLVFLAPEDASQENMDPDDEIALAEKMIAQRNAIIRNQIAKEGMKASSSKVSVASSVAEDEEDTATVAEPVSAKGKGKRSAVSKAASIAAAKERKAANDKLRRERVKAERERERERELEKEQKREREPSIARSGNIDDDYYDSLPSELTVPVNIPQEEHDQRHHRAPFRRGSVTPEPHPRRYSPYKLSPVHSSRRKTQHELSHSYHLHPPMSVRSRTPPRTMLQHAWHVISTSDPLIDSDDELGDEHVRNDYIQRLQIITRLRGKEPTPEPEHYNSMLVDPSPSISIPDLIHNQA